MLAGIREVRDVMEKAASLRRATGRRTILFIDEIHRFNKSQQDAFLPFVEEGTIVLIGATTENPSFEVNAALLSRSRVYRLERLEREHLVAAIADKYCDFLLVGDSLGMVMHGYETTVPVPLDLMIMHGKAVVRGARRRGCAAGQRAGPAVANARRRGHGPACDARGDSLPAEGPVDPATASLRRPTFGLCSIASSRAGASGQPGRN